MIGTFCILLTVLTAMARTKELTPSDEELEEIRSAPKGLGTTRSREIADAVRAMPVAMHKIGVVFLFQWYAMFIYWQFLAVSLGETIFNATPSRGDRPGTTRSPGAVCRTPPTTSSPWSPRCSWWGSPSGSGPSACTRSPSAWPPWR